MARQPHTDREERRVRVARLLIERRSIRQIARQLGIHRSSIERDVKAIRAEWQEHRIEATDDVIAGELERLATAEAMVWPLIRFGDLAAVDRLLRIQERRAKLLGLDAPTKVDISGIVWDEAKAAGLSDDDAHAAVREAVRIARGSE